MTFCNKPTIYFHAYRSSSGRSESPEHFIIMLLTYYNPLTRIKRFVLGRFFIRTTKEWEYTIGICFPIISA